MYAGGVMQALLTMRSLAWSYPVFQVSPVNRLRAGFFLNQMQKISGDEGELLTPGIHFKDCLDRILKKRDPVKVFNVSFFPSASIFILLPPFYYSKGRDNLPPPFRLEWKVDSHILNYALMYSTGVVKHKNKLKLTFDSCR